MCEEAGVACTHARVQKVQAVLRDGKETSLVWEQICAGEEGKKWAVSRTQLERALEAGLRGVDLIHQQ